MTRWFMVRETRSGSLRHINQRGRMNLMRWILVLTQAFKSWVRRRKEGRPEFGGAKKLAGRPARQPLRAGLDQSSERIFCLYGIELDVVPIHSFPQNLNQAVGRNNALDVWFHFWLIHPHRNVDW